MPDFRCASGEKRKSDEGLHEQSAFVPVRLVSADALHGQHLSRPSHVDVGARPVVEATLTGPHPVGRGTGGTSTAKVTAGFVPTHVPPPRAPRYLQAPAQ
jgi:hypothetical protein